MSDTYRRYGAITQNLVQFYQDALSPLGAEVIVLNDTWRTTGLDDGSTLWTRQYPGALGT